MTKQNTYNLLILFILVSFSFFGSLSHLFSLALIILMSVGYVRSYDQNIQDFKTKLQELSQQKSKKLPEYSLVKKEGPSHSPVFTVSLKVLNLKKIKASGSSIREAEKNAAKTALSWLNDQ